MKTKSAKDMTDVELDQAISDVSKTFVKVEKQMQSLNKEKYRRIESADQAYGESISMDNPTDEQIAWLLTHNHRTSSKQYEFTQKFLSHLKIWMMGFHPDTNQAALCFTNHMAIDITVASLKYLMPHLLPQKTGYVRMETHSNRDNLYIEINKENMEARVVYRSKDVMEEWMPLDVILTRFRKYYQVNDDY